MRTLRRLSCAGDAPYVACAGKHRIQRARAAAGRRSCDPGEREREGCRPVPMRPCDAAAAGAPFLAGGHASAAACVSRAPAVTRRVCVV